jgi:transcription elongation factor
MPDSNRRWFFFFFIRICFLLRFLRKIKYPNDTEKIMFGGIMYNNISGFIADIKRDKIAANNPQNKINFNIPAFF